MDNETYSLERLLEKKIIDQQSFVQLKTKNEEEVTERHKDKEEEETKRRKDKEEEETKRRKEEEETKRTTLTSGSCTFNILLSKVYAVHERFLYQDRSNFRRIVTNAVVGIVVLMLAALPCLFQEKGGVEFYRELYFPVIGLTTQAFLNLYNIHLIVDSFRNYWDSSSHNFQRLNNLE